METKELNPESVVNHFRELKSSIPYSLLVQYWYRDREAIIHEGKKSRASEKGSKMWAALEGFDRAVTMVDKILEKLTPSGIENPLEESE